MCSSNVHFYWVMVVNLTSLLKSDASLIRAYAGGDVAAFETLYRRHKDGLFNFIYRSVARQAVAEEIAQDVWLSLIKASANYQPGAATFRSWLYSIARNKIVDFFRRAANRHVSDDAVGDRSGERHQATCGTDEPLPQGLVSDVETNLLVNQLLAALDGLPAEQREAFILQQEGFTAKEIADITGASKEAVKSRLRYAKTTARALLEARG